MKMKVCIIVLLMLIVIVSFFLLFKLPKNTPIDSTKEITGNTINNNDDFPSKPVNIKLDDLINEYINKENIGDKISIFINDFNGTTYAYNENNNFIAASIYKIPLAMIYYEKIYNGEYSLSDTFCYYAYQYESGGPIGDNYEVGSYFTLETLLNYMILYSDNTAGHILFENLGGWESFKKIASKYSKDSLTLDDEFYGIYNVLNANYMNDVLNYLYDNKSIFNQLINNMMVPNDFDYLSKYVDSNIAQKYGYYGNAVNSAGIVFGTKPYSIVIFTELGDAGIEHIAQINKICFDYFSNSY